jgi:hypothetical protein
MSRTQRTAVLENSVIPSGLLHGVSPPIRFGYFPTPTISAWVLGPSTGAS